MQFRRVWMMCSMLACVASAYANGVESATSTGQDQGVTCTSALTAAESKIMYRENDGEVEVVNKNCQCTEDKTRSGWFNCVGMVAWADKKKC